MTVDLAAYLPVAVFFLVAAGMAAMMVMLSHMLGPEAKETRPTFLSPYECGIHTRGLAVTTRYPVKFALIAIVFVLFDIELVFLIPWAVAFDAYRVSLEALSFWLLEMLIFIAILVVGFIYILAKDILRWEF